MDSTRVPRELRVLMNTTLSDCFVLLVMASYYAAIKWIGAATPFEMTPPDCLQPHLRKLVHYAITSPYNPLIEMKKLMVMESN